MYIILNFANFASVFMLKKPGTILFLVFVAGLAAGFFIYPGTFLDRYSPWRLGLDLVGGTQVIFEADLSSIPSSDRNQTMSGLRDVMERRINFYGVSEPQVVVSNIGESHRLIVELAGISDPAAAINQIGRVAFLEFKEVEEMPGRNGEPQYRYLPTSLNGRHLRRAQAVVDQTTYKPQIEIQFSDEGAGLFEELTAKNVGRPLAIFLDEAVVSSPVVQEKISGGRAVISGQFTIPEAQNLAGLLNAGALPASVKLISQQTVGASLGLNSLNRTLFAGLIGVLAVMLFMVIYYRLFGVFAVLTLAVYVVLTLAIFKFISVTMSLATIAGFILSVGMAVDANILIFERIKEEIKRGMSRITAIEEGFRRAWPSIRDSNVSTIITSLILYYLTTSFVQGFALALLVGVLVSMFTAITATRTILRFCVRN